MKLLAKLPWLSLILLFVVPYLLLAVAGSAWLVERGLFFPWLGLALALLLVGLPLRWFLRRRGGRTGFETISPSPNWTPREELAWKEIERLSERMCRKASEFQTAEEAWGLARETLEVIARAYHGDSTAPLLEVTVPHLLKVTRLVAQDLERAFATSVPGAHILTVQDILRIKRLGSVYSRALEWIRIARFAMNPAAGLVESVKSATGGAIIQGSAADLRNWGIDFVVKRFGYYAIELYSGRLTLDDEAFLAHVTKSSAKALDQAERRDEAIEGEPLRILILGQVKAGKSSLINALFGETRAEIGVVPTTSSIVPHLLEREGRRLALVFDSAGYEEPGRQSAWREVLKVAPSCDLILIVSSAIGAARDADRRSLDVIRATLAEDSNRPAPPILAVMTHIDRLRPLKEWSPPYDLRFPDPESKAANILDAADHVADDLAIAPESVIPVCALAPDYYNVEEGLAPAILAVLPEAERSRYLRCLKSYHDADYWSRLRTQTRNAGRVLWQVAPQALRSRAGSRPNSK